MTSTEVEPHVLRLGSIGGLTISRPGDNTNRVLNILVYGDPGVGKTVFAASACEVEAMSPVLVIDVEGGDLSLVRQHPGVDVVRVKSFEQFNGLYAALRTGDHGYKTVVLDSISEIQKFGMYYVMKKVLLEDPDRDPDLPGIGEWGKNTEQIRKLVRAFRDLPCNTIITALAQNELSESGAVRKTKPLLSNKLSIELPGFFDVVGYMYMKATPDPMDPKQMIQVRCLLSMATQKQVAKDRTGVLPPVLEDPTMALVYDTVYPGDTQQGTTR